MKTARRRLSECNLSCFIFSLNEWRDVVTYKALAITKLLPLYDMRRNHLAGQKRKKNNNVALHPPVELIRSKYTDRSNNRIVSTVTYITSTSHLIHAYVIETPCLCHACYTPKPRLRHVYTSRLTHCYVTLPSRLSHVCAMVTTGWFRICSWIALGSITLG